MLDRLCVFGDRGRSDEASDGERREMDLPLHDKWCPILSHSRVLCDIDVDRFVLHRLEILFIGVILRSIHLVEHHL